MWPSTVWLWAWIQKDGSYGGSPRSIRSFCAPAMATNRNTGPCAQSSAPRGTGRGLRRCGFRMAAPAGRTLLFLMNESPSRRRTFWLRSTLPSRGTQRRPSILHGVECRVEDCLTNLSRLSCHGADIRSHRRSTSACWRRTRAEERKERREEWGRPASSLSPFWEAERPSKHGPELASCPRTGIRHLCRSVLERCSDAGQEPRTRPDLWL